MLSLRSQLFLVELHEKGQLVVLSISLAFSFKISALCIKMKHFEEYHSFCSLNLQMDAFNVILIPFSPLLLLSKPLHLSWIVSKVIQFCLYLALYKLTLW
jgi:hypothetical protein